MDPRDLPANSMMLRFDIQADGDLRIIEAQHFGDDIAEEAALEYMSLVRGLVAILNFSSDFVIGIGSMAMYVDALEAEDEIAFEPDEELLEAMADAKIVPFNKNKMN